MEWRLGQAGHSLVIFRAERGVLNFRKSPSPKVLLLPTMARVESCPQFVWRFPAPGVFRGFTDDPNCYFCVAIHKDAD